MKPDVIEIRWPGWAAMRDWIRAVLGVRVPAGGDAGQVQREAEERRYNSPSRCC